MTHTHAINDFQQGALGLRDSVGNCVWETACTLKSPLFNSVAFSLLLLRGHFQRRQVVVCNMVPEKSTSKSSHRSSADKDSGLHPSYKRCETKQTLLWTYSFKQESETGSAQFHVKRTVYTGTLETNRISSGKVQTETSLQTF